MNKQAYEVSVGLVLSKQAAPMPRPNLNTILPDAGGLQDAAYRYYRQYMPRYNVQSTVEGIGSAANNAFQKAKQSMHPARTLVRRDLTLPKPGIADPRPWVKNVDPAWTRGLPGNYAP